MRFEFHPEAESELIESAAYYETKVAGLGRRFSGEVQEAINLILDNPGIGRPLDENLRCFVLGAFPYSIVYGVHGQTLFVVAVAPSRRKPGYWKARSFR